MESDRSPVQPGESNPQLPAQRYELHAGGRQPRVYMDPRQAGAAFYAANAQELPRLYHFEEDSPRRTAALTLPFMPTEGQPELPYKDVKNGHPIDAEIRAGYYDAVERSVLAGLAVTDWEKATNREPWTPPRLEPRLFDDLQALALGHRERAIQAWTEQAPQWVLKPTFVDRVTGQVVSLDTTADLGVAKAMQEHRYGPPQPQVKTIQPPEKGQSMDEQQQRPVNSLDGLATPPRVRLDPAPEYWLNKNVQADRDTADARGLTAAIEAQFAQGKTAQQVSSAMAKELEFLPEMGRSTFIINLRSSLGIPSRMSEEGERDFARWKADYDKRAGAPQQKPSKQPEIDFKAIDKVTFSRATANAGPQYTVRAYGADGKVLKEQAGVPQQDLATHFGPEVAQAIIDTKGRGRTLQGAELRDAAEPVQARPQAAPEAPQQPRVGEQAAQAAAQPPIDEQANTIARGASSKQAVSHAQQPRAPQQSERPEQPASTPQQAPQQSAPAEQTPKVAPATAETDKDALEARRRELVLSLGERFTIKGDDYRFKADPSRIAFKDRGNWLSSHMDHAFVVRGMVDAAEAKGWSTLNVRGTEDFRRQAWMEGSLRGLEVKGYNPTIEDRQRLEQRQKQAQRNAVEPGQPAQAQQQPTAIDVGRQQVLAVVRASLKAQGITGDDAKRVMAEANRQIDAMRARGEPLPRIKVIDRNAPSIAQAQMAHRQEQAQATQPHRSHGRGR
jgi:hypothetical protein